MISSLKNLFVPALRERGFKGTFPHFRRRRSDRIDLLTVQFDRHGGGFIIEISNDPRVDGKFRISLTYDEATRSGKTTAQTDTYHGRFVDIMPNQRIVEIDEFETEEPALHGQMKITIELVKETAARLWWAPMKVCRLASRPKITRWAGRWH